MGRLEYLCRLSQDATGSPSWQLALRSIDQAGLRTAVLPPLLSPPRRQGRAFFADIASDRQYASKNSLLGKPSGKTRPSRATSCKPRHFVSPALAHRSRQDPARPNTGLAERCGEDLHRPAERAKTRTPVSTPLAGKVGITWQQTARSCTSRPLELRHLATFNRTLAGLCLSSIRPRPVSRTDQENGTSLFSRMRMFTSDGATFIIAAVSRFHGRSQPAGIGP
jgi:hypothetical protein